VIGKGKDWRLWLADSQMGGNKTEKGIVNV
jgi:hypothetical protein